MCAERRGRNGAGTPRPDVESERGVARLTGRRRRLACESSVSVRPRKRRDTLLRRLEGFATVRLVARTASA